MKKKLANPRQRAPGAGNTSPAARAGNTASRQRVALYHRVSGADQDVTLARDELREVARVAGTVVLDIEETGSGASNDRPGLQRVLDAARRGQLDLVLVWKLDRWGRSALDLLANIRALEDAGVRFRAVTQGIDIKPDGDPMSRLVVTMLAALAEFERDLIRERTQLGLAKARARGRHLGRPRKGNAPVPHEVLAYRVLGASWAWIAAELGCTSSAARRAAGGNTSAPACQNGVPKTAPELSGK